MNNKLKLSDSTGTFEAELLRSFELDNKTYIIYTKNEIDNNMLKLYVSQVDGNRLVNVEQSKWEEIKQFMRNWINGVNNE